MSVCSNNESCTGFPLLTKRLRMTPTCYVTVLEIRNPGGLSSVPQVGTSKAKIKVSARLSSLSQGPGRESTFKLLQTVGRINFTVFVR